MTLIDRAILHSPEPDLEAGSRGVDDLFLARLDRSKVGRDRALDPDSVVGSAARLVYYFGTGDQRFGWRAARVDARAAEQMAFHYGDGHACGREAIDEGRSGLAGAHYNGIELLIHMSIQAVYLWRS